jgi:hypothetical protein
MKRMMLLLLVLTATGCIELPIRPEPDAKFMKTTKTSDVKEAKLPPVKEPPAVAPEQVNDANAPQMLDALREEMDRAAAERPSEPKP